MKEQKVVTTDIEKEYENIVCRYGLKHIFLICGKTVCATSIGKFFLQHNSVSVWFHDFQPNPTYESVVEAINQYKENGCDGILAVGGGSAIDVAKCVKAFVNMNCSTNYLKQVIEENTIPFFAIPTTAGTGSEATRFAVIYFEGQKQSVSHESLIPDVVFLDSTLLTTLPIYQKKATFLDAMSHCVESFWAVDANLESRIFAANGIRLIFQNYKAYLNGDTDAAKQMLIAANDAGKAINITRTTAAHAMCYQITKKYGLPHGHAVAICLANVWEYTWEKAVAENRTVLRDNLLELAHLFGCDTVEKAVEKYKEFLTDIQMNIDLDASESDIEELAKSVNIERLGNHPVKLTGEELTELYEKILGKSDKQ